MSLRIKIAIVLLAAAAGFMGTDVLLRRASFATAFESLERDRASEELQRIEGAVRGVPHEMVDVANAFVALAGADVAARIEQVDVLKGEPLPILVLVDRTGKVLAHRVVDPATGSPARVPEFPNEQLSPRHPVMRQWAKADGATPPLGLFATRRGLVALGSIEVPDRSGSGSNLLIVGRYFDGELLARVREEARAEFDFLLPAVGGVSAEAEALIAVATSTREPALAPSGEGRLVAYGIVDDLGEAPAIALRVELKRTEHALWAALERYELLSALGVVVLFPFVLLVLLQAIVTGPLSKLKDHAVAIGQKDDPSLRLDMDRGDEIGQLAREFDGMLAKLEASQDAAAKNARLVGRSEIAVGVMHHVGTALNSVGVSASLCRNRIDGLELGDLRAIFAELEKHRGNLDAYLESDERGQHLMPFLESFIERLEATSQEARGEAASLVDGVEEIVTLVASLRGMEGEGDGAVVSKIQVTDELDKAIEIAQSSTGFQVDVQRDFAELPEVRIDQQRLFEAFLAILRNALESVREAAPEFPMVRATVRAEGDKSFAVSITDNGVGIAPYQLDRIFV